jgi:hypothetical protein
MLCLGIAASWQLVRLGPILIRSDPPDLVSTSPDGRWSLEIHALSQWSYGPHSTRVLVHRLEGPWWRRLPGEFLALDFDLHNDGASLGPWNLAAAWVAPDSVQLFAHGQEQADTTYLVDVEQARTSAIWNRVSLFASLWMLLLLATLVLEALILLFTAGPPPHHEAPPDTPSPPP